MASLRVVNRLVCRGFVALTLLLVFFNEFIVYYMAQSSWQPIDCKLDNCTRLLLIADPQILGNSYDRSSHSPLARYDSDRYLAKTFERALAFTQPHIIVFLGDLLDEGNIATAQEYKQYVQRFRRIYQNKNYKKRVHVPGDNDIGGENGDYISNSNQRRFENEFMSEDLFDYDNRLRFFKINRMLLDFSNPDRDNNADRLRIGVSHAPLLIGGGPLLRAIISDLDPHIIFSGHWHESRIFIYPSTKVINFYENAVRHFDLKALKEQEHSYLEIMVPTCSYRMGKSKIGLGYAVLASVWASSSRFQRLPQSQSVVENESVKFECESTDSYSELHYDWLHNGHRIAYDKRVHQIGSNLHIEAARRTEDVGSYVCIATNLASGAREASPPAKLSVIYLESASVQLLGSNRNELLLKCHVEGASGDSEPLEIEWYRNSEKLSTWKNVQLDQHRLIIRQPGSDDDGLYRCTASNAAGRVMSKQGYAYQSSVKCLPRLARRKNQKMMESWDKQTFLCRGKRGGAAGLEALPAAPEDLRIVQGPVGQSIIKEGEPTALTCLYELPDELKNQRIQLRWRKDGKLLRQVELGGSAPITGHSFDSGKDALLREDARLVLHKQNGTLSFASIIASDAGQYQCQLQLEGHLPISSTPGVLEVIEQLKFVPQPTSKNLELDAVVAKVHCKAQGTPTPQVQWVRDGENSTLPDQVEVDANGTLIFRNVNSEHRGNYTCLASNTQGQINATVAINVVVTPKFSVPPVGPIETSEQGTVVMHCQAIGDPKPTIQWDKDLKYLSENNTDRERFRFLENGTLEIRNVQVEDEGSYGCTIGNSAGLKREDVQLVVKTTGDGFAPEESGGDGFLVTRAVLITMTVALAYIVLVVGLMLWCRYRRQARKARLNDLSTKEAGGDQPDAAGNGKGSEQEPCLSKQHNGHSKSRSKSSGDAQKSDDTACSQQSRASKKSAHIYEQLALPRSGLSELIQIGRGEFGDVFVGKLKATLVTSPTDKDADTEKQHSNSENGSGGSGSGSTTLSTLNEKRRSKTSMDDIEEIKEEEQEQHNQSALEQLVLVKALNKVKDEQACQEFRRQLDLLRAISHKGVVRLFGLCREKDPHYMVLEYTDWGDLKQFLLATAGKVNTATAGSSSPPPLTTSQVLAVAYQIARGMDAIYRARFTHRDLATRNCVISSEFIVKVSYPALCKDKYSREYHKHRNTLLPIRWLAPECIQEDEYTTKSDIFAYGVVVWELFNQATKLPHEELTNEQVVQRSQAGSLEWSVAEATPDSLREILLSCWVSNPKERPSFSQLGAALSKAMQSVEK